MSRSSVRRRRGSLLFPLVVIAVGVVWLLVNLGVVSSSIWSELIRFWPVLLIVLGIDVLVGRPSLGSALATLITVCVVVGLGLAAFFFFGPESWTVRELPFDHPVGSATEASIDLACEACSMSISGGMAGETLIEGTITVRRDQRIRQLTRRDGESARYELHAVPLLSFIPRGSASKHPWWIQLHPEVTIDLTVASDGPMDLDFRDVHLVSADISAGNERCVIVLPQTGHASIHLAGDDVIVRVPDGVGVRVIGTASATLGFPADFAESAGEHRSLDYDVAESTVDLYLRPGTAAVEMEPLEADPVSET